MMYYPLSFSLHSEGSWSRVHAVIRDGSRVATVESGKSRVHAVIGDGSRVITVRSGSRIAVIVGGICAAVLAVIARIISRVEKEEAC